MSRNLFQLAEHFLAKAEKRALAIENLELLDLIYTEFIRLSQEMLSINPETYILKRQGNELKLKSIRQIDDVLATVKYKLKITQNFSPVDNPVVDMLQETVQKLTDSQELKGGSALRFKIYHAVSQILLSQHDFPNLEDYLRVTYADFDSEKLFNKGNHQTKLQMLTYMVNALFKNDKLEESLEWAEKLKLGMEEYDCLHYDRFMFFYFNSLVINYSKMDMEKAISILVDLEHNEKLKKTPFYIVFVYLNLSIFHFDLGRYRQSIKRLNQLYHHEKFANTAEPLKFRIAILEVLVRIELNDTDFLEYRLKQIRKDFSENLTNQENVRESMLLDLIEDIFLKGISSRSEQMKDRIKLFAKTNSPRSEDAELVSYNGWLSGKLKARTSP
jgi:tetratricopeptide (TPR) repeat protein